jgi:hypothetical protein
MKRLMSRPFPPIVLTDHCTLIRLPTKIEARRIWAEAARDPDPLSVAC